MSNFPNQVVASAENWIFLLLLAVPLPAADRPGAPELCWGTQERFSQVMLVFVPRAGGSEGGCGLPRRVVRMWDAAPLCLGLHPSRSAAVPPRMPGLG